MSILGIYSIYLIYLLEILLVLSLFSVLGCFRLELFNATAWLRGHFTWVTMSALPIHTC